VLAAAGGGHVEVLTLLVQAGADLSRDGLRALQSAVENEQPAVVGFLLAQGVDTNGAIVPPLTAAAMRNDLVTLRALHAGGVPIETPDARGRTP
jgi:ankyrin repeat protein